MARGQAYQYEQPTGSLYNQFSEIGDPGRYVQAVRVGSSTIVDFTGSLYGYGAFLIQDATNVEITASNGVGLPGAAFNTKTMYDIGIRRINIGATGVVYAFRRQQ
jgi:hypothetical protein